MSRKVATFAQIITNPLNKYNFLVKIPEADLAVVVQSTVFPSEKLRQITLYFQGEPIIYPTIPESDHSWKVSLPESDSAAIKKQFDKLKSKFWDQKTGTFIPGTWKDVEVIARDQANNFVFSAILHGCWLKGRNPVELANNDPTQNWSWDYEFVYQWIEDKDYVK